MANYTVHLPPDARTTEEVASKALFIKDGFAYGGFIFTGLWLLSKRLWLFALGYVLLLALIVMAFRWFGVPFGAFALVQALLGLLIGYEGNEWQRRKLAHKGWQQSAVVSGVSLEECERRFFAGWLSAKPSTPPALPVMTDVAPPAPATVLGLFPQPRGGA
jgi:Protein of unknown function (DUF2628)